MLKLKDHRSIVGTIRWAGLNFPNGIDAFYIIRSCYIVDVTPRDDIESLASLTYKSRFKIR
jgi:hypothetical protein